PEQRTIELDEAARPFVGRGAPARDGPLALTLDGEPFAGILPATRGVDELEHTGPERRVYAGEIANDAIRVQRAGRNPAHHELSVLLRAQERAARIAIANLRVPFGAAHEHLVARIEQGVLVDVAQPRVFVVPTVAACARRPFGDAPFAAAT